MGRKRAKPGAKPRANPQSAVPNIPQDTERNPSYVFYPKDHARNRCTRCGGPTFVYRTANGVQYRRCQLAVCHTLLQVPGVRVEDSDRIVTKSGNDLLPQPHNPIAGEGPTP